MAEFPAFYQTELRPHLERLEEQRQQVARRVVRVGLVVAGAILLAALGGGLYAVSQASPEASDFLMWFVPAVIIGGIVFAVVYHQMTKGFVAEFKDTIIARMVRFVSPDLSYHKDDYIRKPAYMQSRIFLQNPHRYRGEDLVRGSIGKTAIQFSEVHSEYKTESTDSKGRRTEHWHTIFKGIFFIADFNKHFHGETVVLPDVAERMLGQIGQALQSWNIARKGELVRLEDPEFEQRFVVYSDDQIEARYLLSTSLMARIVDFVKRTGHEVYLSFVAAQLHVAISYRKDLFEPKLFSSVLDIKLSQDYLEDLLLATSIVEDLNLNTRIWSKQ